MYMWCKDVLPTNKKMLCVQRIYNNNNNNFKKDDEKTPKLARLRITTPFIYCI